MQKLIHFGVWTKIHIFHCGMKFLFFLHFFFNFPLTGWLNCEKKICIKLYIKFCKKKTLALTRKYEIVIDGWMTCDFTSFSTVFQSYQDDGQMIMKGCVQWNPVYG